MRAEKKSSWPHALPLLALVASAALLAAPVVWAAGLLASETDGSTIVSESGTSDSLMFRLDSQPSADVNVSVAAMDSTEVSVSPPSLRFTSANWNVAQTVTVRGVDDAIADGDQSTVVRFEASSGDAAFHGLVSTVNVITSDNESAAQMISQSEGSTRVSEQGTTDTFEVVLTAQPTSNVFVDVRSANTAEVMASPEMLLFQPDSWSSWQKITVRGVDDAAVDGDQSVAITLSFRSADPKFDQATMTVMVTNQDNEAAAAARPMITAPPEGAKLAGMSTMVTWQNPDGTTQYQIQVIPMNEDGPGINLIRNVESSFIIEDPDFGADEPNYVMLPDMTYSVRIRTTASGSTDVSESDWSQWSDLRHFETSNVSSATILLEGPNGGASVDSLRPRLRWSNQIDDVYYYEVQLSRDPAFCGVAGCPMLYWELIHGGLSDPLNSYLIPAAFPLDADATYHWRMRPRIQGDGSPVAWSGAASFHTAADASAREEAATGGAAGSVGNGVVKAEVFFP